ncbi:MAG: hypothetical protein WCA56_10560 [Xanthobacteraceae bacterium]
MTSVTKLLAAVFVMSMTVPALAQSPQTGDYYKPGQTVPQQASPGQEQQFKQGDYYKPTGNSSQEISPAQAQEQKQGDYYKPGSR